MRIDKTKDNQKLLELMIPNTWYLFETIDHLAKFADMRRKVKINEPRSLSHIDIFKQMALKKEIIDIWLVKRSTSTDSKIEDKTHNGWFDHWAKYVMIVHPRALVKSFSNQTCLVPVNRASRKSKRKIHLHSTIFCEGVDGTSSQVPFREKTSNSLDIA